MAHILQFVLHLCVVIFLLGNLAGVGLELALGDAVAALRNIRFIVWATVWGFLLCPAFAYLLTKTIPLDRPLAIGLLLLGMAPGAPFMPIMVKKARGDLSYTAAFMLLTAAGTVVFMPLGLPLMVEGMAVNAWVIATPLLSFVLAPLVVGAAIRKTAAPLARCMSPIIKKITDAATVVMLAAMVPI